jgi:multidrug resistance efflux pump
LLTPRCHCIYAAIWRLRPTVHNSPGRQSRKPTTSSLVNADSCWVDGYFEETNLDAIHPGDHATLKLMGYRAPLLGRVASIARAITVANAAPGQSGLAQVNPIFTWVRLAQRVPVRIDLDRVPDGVLLVAGQTATVQILPGTDSHKSE